MTRSVAFGRRIGVVICLAAMIASSFAVADQHQDAAPVTSAVTLADIEARLATVERLVKSEGLLDMLQQIASLEQALAKLQGEVEVNRHALEEMRDHQRDLYADIDRRLQQHATSQTADDQPESAADEEVPDLLPVGPLTDPTQPEDAGAAAVVSKADPVQTQAQYQRAFQLLKESRYDQAIKAFGEFLQAYPDDQYADNAQYWIAEAWYVKGEFKAAIDAYNTLIADHPDSQKIPQGVLKIGDSYNALGDLDNARLWYTDVKQRFPETISASMATERLSKLRRSDP